MPSGWAFCAGQVLSVAEHPDLAFYLGNTFGGDGVTTFALPDLRGRVILGTGQGVGLANRALAPVGADAEALGQAHIPAHRHGLPGGGTTSSYGAASPSPMPNLQASHGLTFAIVTSGIYPSFETNPFAGDDRVIGEIVIYATTNLPSGVLPCDGRLLQISTNTALFTIIGNLYGGNGFSTFALPDLRGRVPAGSGEGLGLTSRDLGDQFGIEQSTLLTSQFPFHAHPLPAAPGAIPNPSFEADTFGGFPGYAGGGNGLLSGWSHIGTAGLNPAGGSSPFANNGAIPRGSKAAFIQSAENVASSLSTTVYGLVPGTAYTVGFRTNSRAGYAPPGLTWSVNGSGLIPCVSASVGGSNPYHTVTGTFTATSPLATITLQNQTATDSAALLDDFTLTAGTSPAWSVSAWTGDASTGLTPIRTLWASLFSSSANTAVNEVSVTNVPGINPAVLGRFSVSGFTNVFTNDTNTLVSGTGGSSILAANFLFGANNGTVTFEGLTPGVAYRATFFSVGWDNSPTTRVISLGSPNDSLTVDQNSYGNNHGIRLDHNFTASATTHTVSLKPATSGTFHLYALGLSVRDSVLWANWRQEEFGAAATNPTVAGDTADPDGDGLANLLEYALLSEPQSVNLVPFAAPVPVTLPGPVEARQFSFPYRPNARDLTYVLQRSGNLQTWTDTYRLNLATGSVTQLPGVRGSTNASAQTVTVTITDLSLFDTPYFWRLQTETN